MKLLTLTACPHCKRLGSCGGIFRVVEEWEQGALCLSRRLSIILLYFNNYVEDCIYLVVFGAKVQITTSAEES